MNMKYLAVIPARGGSKGIKKKNIALLCGKPLLGYTIEAARMADINGDIVVSTDDKDIAETAGGYSIEVIWRPKAISGDTAKTEEALIHALDYMKKMHGKTYDAVITMQPTSPFRKPETIRNFLKEYEKNRTVFDALLTLSEDRTDFWEKRDDGSFTRLFPDAPRRRQERKPLYAENSCLYVTDTEALRGTKSVLGRKVNGIVISSLEGLDINEPMDLVIAESYMGKHEK